MGFLKSLFGKSDDEQRFDALRQKVLGIDPLEAFRQIDTIIAETDEYRVESCDESPLLVHLGEATTKFFRRYPKLVPEAGVISLGQDQFERLEIEGFPQLIKIGMDNTSIIACVPHADTVFIVDEYYDSPKDILDSPYPSVAHYLIEDYEYEREA